MTMTLINDAWGNVGSALWNLPDTELADLEAKLRSWANAQPGRAATALHAFADMVKTERAIRHRDSNHDAARTRT